MKTHTGPIVSCGPKRVHRLEDGQKCTTHQSPSVSETSTGEVTDRLEPLQSDESRVGLYTPDHKPRRPKKDLLALASSGLRFAAKAAFGAAPVIGVIGHLGGMTYKMEGLAPVFGAGMLANMVGATCLAQVLGSASASPGFLIAGIAGLAASSLAFAAPEFCVRPFL